MAYLNAEHVSMAHEIAQYIKQLHGATITAPDLSQRFHIHPSHIRGLINLARTEGLPVCSTTKGYYWSENPEDIKSTIDHIKYRIERQQEAIKGLEATIYG